MGGTSKHPSPPAFLVSPSLPFSFTFSRILCMHVTHSHISHYFRFWARVSLGLVRVWRFVPGMPGTGFPISPVSLGVISHFGFGRGVVSGGLLSVFDFCM